MNLIINGTAIRRWSLGAIRYYEGVMRHLNWPGSVEVTPPGHFAWTERLGDFLERGRRDAVYWSPSHRGPLFAQNHVVTVLDCINIQYTYKGDWRLPLLRANFGALLAHAAVVVTISNATRNAVLENFQIDPSKVLAISGPTDFRAEMAATEKPVPPPDDFILMVTNSLPHKNTARAAASLAASSAVRRGTILRVVGSLDPVGIATCHMAGLKVEQYRGIDDLRLRQWLRQCRFLFVPSLEEGLNLPIGEALALGGNVLCSDIPVHREFYDGAVMVCDPTSESAMTDAIDDALSRHSDWNLSHRRRTFRTFADIASDYRALFQRVAAGEFSRRRIGRRLGRW